jgi:hypothetical protein
VQWSTLPNCVEKIQFSREDGCAGFTLGQMRLDSRTLVALQLVVEIQRQSSLYVVALSHF